ncbi:MAG: hypothetical protein HQK58_13670 [Deltaproteobacteria bacterium]|nr:hypothetical protein [Deltaproteobacteria bacterium]
MISLGGVTLPDLFWDDVSWTGVDTRKSVSLAGTPIVWAQSVGSTGQPIDLVGGPDQGWIDRDTLKTLQRLASVPNATYLLTYENISFIVRFRTEEPPTISAKPIVSRPNMDGADWYSDVLIKLARVN